MTSSALKLNGGTLQLRNDSTVTFASASTALSGTVTVDVGAASTGTNQTLSLGATSMAAGTNLTVTNATGSTGYALSLGTITIAGNITINTTTANVSTGALTGSGNLTKNGTGTWTLNGTTYPQGYPAVITVNAGTLALGLANAITNATGFGAKMVASGGTFDLNGYSQAFASIDSSNTAGTITNSSTTTAATLTVDDTNQAGSTQTYAGVLKDNGGAGKLNLKISSNDSYQHSTILTLSNANSSYSGVTTVQGGTASNFNNNANTLAATTLANGGANSSIGAASSAAANIVLDYGGTLKYTGGTVSTDRLFSVGGNYGGIVNASGSGAVNFNNTGTIGFNGSTNARYLALVGSNTGSNTLAATITNNTGLTSVTKGDGGTWVLSNTANSYTGATIIGGGVLNVPSLAAGGANSPIGAAATTASNLVFAGGTLQYTGTTDQTTNRLFTVAATGGAIDSSGSGTLSFTNAGANASTDPASRAYYSTGAAPSGVALVQSAILATDLVAGMTVGGSGGTATSITSINSANNITTNGSFNYGPHTLTFSSVDRTLTLKGSNSGANTVAGILADSPTKKLGVTKDGTGNWTLTGASTYTGATTVTEGTLTVNGSLATGSAVAVNSSGGVAGILTGTGTINGPVTVNSGGYLNPGLSTGSGTLTINNTLTLNASSFANFVLTNSSTYNKVTGITGVNYGGTLNISLAAGANITAGTYQLFSYSGSPTVTTNFGSVVTPALSGGLTWGSFDPSNGSIAVLPSSWSTASYNLTLASAGGTHFRTGSTVNLTATINNTGGSSSSDFVDFTGLGATLTGGIGGTLGGPTSVVGPNPVGYNSSATATGITYANSVSGNYTLTASTTSTQDHNLHDLPTLTSAQSLIIQFYDGVSTWTGTANGNWGDFAKWSATGGVPGIDGAASVNDTATFGHAGIAGPISVDLVGTSPTVSALSFNGNTSYTIAASGSGVLTLANAAGVAVSVAGAQAISAPVVLSNNTTITTVSSGDSLTLSGLVSGTGGGSGTTLTVAGPGTFILSHADTYSGATAITAGKLQSGIANALPTATDLTLSGGTFDLNGHNQTLASLAGVSGAAVDNSSASAAQLTVNGSGNTTYGGAITNSGAGALSLAKSGSGSLTLNGAVGLTGGIAVSGGKLTLGAVNSFTGGIALSGGGTLNVNSTGALGNAANVLTVSGGTLDNTSGAALVVPNNNPVTLNGSFAFSTSAGTASNNLTLPGAVSLPVDAAITLNGAGALTFSGTLTNTADSVRTLTVNNGTGTTATSILSLGSYALTGAGSTARTDVITGSGKVVITGAVSNGLTAGSGLSYTGTGMLTLAAANSYTGPTSVSSGTLLLSNTAAVANSALKLLGGTLALRSDTGGTFATTSTTIGNIASVGGTMTIDVNPLSSGTNQTLSFGDVGLTTGETVTVSGGNGYTLSMGNIAINGSNDGSTTTPHHHRQSRHRQRQFGPQREYHQARRRHLDPQRHVESQQLSWPPHR